MTGSASSLATSHFGFSGAGFAIEAQVHSVTACMDCEANGQEIEINGKGFALIELMVSMTLGLILAREASNADYWERITDATSVKSNLNSGGTDDVLDFARDIEIYPDADGENAIVDGSHVIV